MSLLRDPLLLTLVASSLAHGVAFSLDLNPTQSPVAAVHSGRTAVRLRPSLADPPKPLADPPKPLTDPPTPLTDPPTPLADPPTPLADPPTPLADQLTQNNLSPTPVSPTPTNRLRPTSPRPKTASPLRQPSPLTKPTPPLTSPLPVPRLRPSTTSAPVPTRPPQPTPPPRIAPPPRPAAVAQPASKQQKGAVRSLPTALPDNPSPVYPVSATRRAAQGVVVVALSIDSNGHVAAATLHRSSGHADLDAAAMTAARLWKFQPARRGQRAVGITVLKPFRFVLRRR
jgi:protein TonB